MVIAALLEKGKKVIIGVLVGLGVIFALGIAAAYYTFRVQPSNPFPEIASLAPEPSLPTVQLSKYEGLTEEQIYIVKVKEDSCEYNYNTIIIRSETQAERYKELCDQQVRDLIEEFRQQN